MVEAIDGPLEVNVCVASGQSCQRQRWCAAHLVWVEAQQAVIRVLRSASIARLAKQTVALRGAGAARSGKRGAKPGNAVGVVAAAKHI